MESQPVVPSPDHNPGADETGHAWLEKRLKEKFPHASAEDVRAAINTVSEVTKSAAEKPAEPSS